jgi:thioesterase-3
MPKGESFWHSGAMAWKKHSYPLQILEGHLDTFFHVNNAVYLEILEEARWDWITQGGYGLERIRAEKQGPVVLAVNIIFKRELKLRQKIVVETQVENYLSRVADIKQIIRGEDGFVHAEATLKFGFFNTEARKMITPPKDWLKALGFSE